MLDRDAITLQDVSARVGILDADLRTAKLRIDRLERETFQQKTRHNMVPARE
jgi:hypothetical protein